MTHSWMFFNILFSFAFKGLSSNFNSDIRYSVSSARKSNKQSMPSSAKADTMGWYTSSGNSAKMCVKNSVLIAQVWGVTGYVILHNQTLQTLNLVKCSTNGFAVKIFF